MLNFRNSGQGAGVGSMFVTKINPVYLWSFPSSGISISGNTNQTVISDSVASVPLTFTQPSGPGTVDAVATNTLSVTQNATGTNAKVALTASVGTLSTFTFSFWALLTSTGNYAQRLLELFSSSGNTFQIDILNNNNYPTIFTTNSNSNGTTYPLSANPLTNYLQNICVTVNGTNYQLYINGVSVLSGSTFPAAGMNSFFIGNNDTNSRGSSCKLVDVRIYKFVLSQAQITALYNANQDVNAVIPTVNFINLY
jgi:hypothetical protein